MVVILIEACISDELRQRDCVNNTNTIRTEQCGQQHTTTWQDRTKRIVLDSHGKALIVEAVPTKRCRQNGAKRNSYTLPAGTTRALIKAEEACCYIKLHLPLSQLGIIQLPTWLAEREGNGLIRTSWRCAAQLHSHNV